MHALIAEVDGRIAGSNFLWEADPVAGIGPITVDPELQNAAIGRRLMQRALECAEQKGLKSVRLVQAAYHARSFPLHQARLRCPRAARRAAGLCTRHPYRRL